VLLGGGGIERLVLLQYVQSLTPDDGQKGRPKHVECYSSKIHLKHLCIWLVLCCIVYSIMWIHS